MRTMTLFALASALLAIGCAPADVTGNYTVALTNGENDCGYDFGWDPGQETTGVQVTASQDESAVALEVTDLVSSAVLNLLLGSDTFTGDVSGNHVSAIIVGTVDHDEDGCTYRLTADLQADLDGDALVGDIAYRPQDYECFLEGCENFQVFSGSRPPSVD